MLPAYQAFPCGLGAKPRNEERDFRVWFHFPRGLNQNLVPSLLRNHAETLAKQVRDYDRLETLTFFVDV